METNRVDIDPELKDAWGIPAIRVTYKEHPDDVAFANFLDGWAVQIMQAAGAKKLWRRPVRTSTGGVHLLGTCRMGDSASNSVIDKYHRTHDVKNLFLCDGSSFVTSGRGQPTMTSRRCPSAQRNTSPASLRPTRSDCAIPDPAYGRTAITSISTNMVGTTEARDGEGRARRLVGLRGGYRSTP